eukprot:6867100-Pyramimonas_sp.AAC.1
MWSRSKAVLANELYSNKLKRSMSSSSCTREVWDTPPARRTSAGGFLSSLFRRGGRALHGYP